MAKFNQCIIFKKFKNVPFNKLLYFSTSILSSALIYLSVSAAFLYLAREKQEIVQISNAIKKAEKISNLDPNLPFERSLQMTLGSQRLGLFTSSCKPIFVNDLSLNQEICNRKNVSFRWFQILGSTEKYIVGYKDDFTFKTFRDEAWPLIKHSLSAYFIFTILLVSISYYVFIHIPSKKISFQIASFLKNKDLTQLHFENISNSTFSNLYRGINSLVSTVSSFYSAEAKLSLARQIVHDLRSPISIALDQVSKGNQADLELIRYSVHKIKEISEELLQSTKDISNLYGVMRVLNEIKLYSNIYKIKIEAINKIASNLNKTIRLNETDLYRFITNAIKNSSESGASLCIVEISSNECFLEIKIFDNGHGASSDVINNIIDGTFTTKLTGNGLGLSGMYKKLKSLGGDVLIISELNKGFELILKIPFYAEIPTLITLIDDDKYIALNWAKLAQASNIQFQHYSSSTHALNNLPLIDKESQIYIDVNLGCENGIDLAYQLYINGYKNLHLATGFSPSEIEKPNFIISVVGKNFPF